MTAEKYTFPVTDGGFDAVFREYRAIFEKQLRTVCDSFCDNGSKYKALYDAASYSLEAGGKRIRPVLAFEMCRVCGGDINDAVPAAVAVEMIHTFSLIHDDLPCMDDDDMRRGRPSCHKAHGEAVALLAGDALSAYAGKYICDSDWTVREITPSEGYLLDNTVHKVGIEPQLYTVEHNQTANDVTEQVVKGNIAIIKHTDNGETQIETPEGGAEFAVYLKAAGSYENAKSSERDYLTCDENGFAQTKELPYGIYTVHQVSGWEGSEKMPDFDVFIAQNGTTYRYLINNVNFESFIKAIKVDAETGNTIPYAGAGFQIFRPDGSKVEMTFTYPEVTTIDTFYTNDAGMLITPEKLEFGKGYSLKEVSAPYGYVLHPEIRNKLKLDPEAAEVVRRVFDEALEGRNTSQIALSLNDDNIPTPGQYFKGKHPDKKKFSYMSDKISWTASMVYKLLTSYVYTGATVGHKRKSGGVGSRKTISQKKEEWIIVEGMHEAIVSKEEFELAQAVIRGGEKNPKRNLRYYPLKGLVCCGNCKRALTRRKLRNEGGYFYQCTYSTHDRDTECPVGERYSEAWIEDTAYKAIGQMLTLVEKKAVKEHEISKRRKSAITECADAIRDLQKQYEQLKAVKLRLYEKYTSGSITKAEYLKRKAETDAKMSENEEAIQQGHQRMQELDSEHPCSDERLDAVLGEYQKGAGLTYELAHALISAIYIHGHDSIEIVWQFKDIFEDAEI